MTDAQVQEIRAMALEMIAGDRVEIATADAGRMLLGMLKTFEEIQAALALKVDRWELDAFCARQAETNAQIDAMNDEFHAVHDALWVRMEELEVLLEQQRRTIEALVEENDLLRAQLYAQGRKEPMRKGGPDA